MKRTNRCPKCGDNVIGPFLQDDTIGLSIDVGGPFNLRKVTFEVFICLSCGFTENYIAERDVIQLKDYLRLKGTMD